MNSYLYIEEILISYVLLFKKFIEDNFLLIQDNARPNVARTVTNFLNEVNIQRLMWPASPDMNPIENLWHILKRTVRQHNVQMLAALRNVVQKEWYNLQ